MTVAVFALLAAVAGEALGRMPGDAATVALRAPEGGSHLRRTAALAAGLLRGVGPRIG